MLQLIPIVSLLLGGSGTGTYRLVEGGVNNSTDYSVDSINTDGACASMMSGDICCYDNNGIQCGFPTTDALADDLRIYGHSASPIGAGANLVGQDVKIYGGQGSMTLVATQANCGAGDTVSVVIDGTTTTCTRSATNDDNDEFTCGASDAALATNLAACLNQATGVDACAGAGCTLFTGVAGTAYVYRASDEPAGGEISVASSGNHAVAANGTDGVVLLPDPQRIYQSTKTLTASTIVGSGAGTIGTVAGGFELVAAQTGKIILPETVIIQYDLVTAAYTGGGNVSARWQYGGTSTIATSAASAASTFADADSDNTSILVPVVANELSSMTALVGANLQLVTTGAFTQPGTAAGTATVTTLYRLVTP